FCIRQHARKNDQFREIKVEETLRMRLLGGVRVVSCTHRQFVHPERGRIAVASALRAAIDKQPRPTGAWRGNQCERMPGAEIKTRIREQIPGPAKPDTLGIEYRETRCRYGPKIKVKPGGIIIFAGLAPRIEAPEKARILERCCHEEDSRICPLPPKI